MYQLNTSLGSLGKQINYLIPFKSYTMLTPDTSSGTQRNKIIISDTALKGIVDPKV